MLTQLTDAFVRHQTLWDQQYMLLNVFLEYRCSALFYKVRLDLFELSTYSNWQGYIIHFLQTISATFLHKKYIILVLQQNSSTSNVSPKQKVIWRHKTSRPVQYNFAFVRNCSDFIQAAKRYIDQNARISINNFVWGFHNFCQVIMKTIWRMTCLYFLTNGFSWDISWGLNQK